MSQLDTYFSRGNIDEHQHRAGMLFLSDFKKRYPAARPRGTSPRVQQRSAAEHFTMNGLEAARAHKALRHLGELRHVVLAVVWQDMAAGVWARERGLRETDGLPLLRAALTSLHVFYGSE